MLKPCKFCGRSGEYVREYIRPLDNGIQIACRNCSAETLCFSNREDAARFWNDGHYTIPSHDERKILDACIRLMGGMVEHFQEYCEFMGWKPDPEDEDEQFIVNYNYRHIVQQLFLWHTHHSGGTSSEAKCRELGIEDGGEEIVFRFEDEAEDEE